MNVINTQTKRNRKTETRTFDSRRGATAVEFALVFPIILIFFVAMTVFTQAFTMRDTAQHAAYEGAREGLKLESTSDDCKRAVENFMKTMNLKGAKVIVEPKAIDISTEKVTVHVAIPFQENAWIAGGFVPEKWSAQSKVSLSRYRVDDDD